MTDETPQEVWLIRHGQTEWSASGRNTGRSDVPLTPTGMEQARALRTRLADQPFALVATSPLARAHETCRLAGQLDAAKTDADLVEWDYGSLEGRTTAEIRRDMPGWSVWDGAIPGGETVDEVGERADLVIERALAARGDVALFAHAHMLRVVAARWLGRQAPTMRW